MPAQNYHNHTRYVTGYHIVLSALLLLGLITSLVNVWIQYAAHYDMLNSILITILFIIALLLFYYVRQFPLKAQDRVIRTEENLRHFMLTHKPLDPRITLPQIIALRFAPDDEFIVLADRAANEELSPTEIKKEIRNWRADKNRM